MTVIHLDILGEQRVPFLSPRMTTEVTRIEFLQGSRCPALHRLITRGWTAFEDGTSKSNRLVKASQE
jgi:hypothetical protein